MPERWTSTKLLSASTFPLKSRQMPEIPTFPRRLLRAYRPRSHARKTGGPAQLSTMRPVQSVNHAPGLYKTSAQPGRAGTSIPQHRPSAGGAAPRMNAGSAAPPALYNLGDPSPSPPPDFLWNLVAWANFMRLSLLKGARAASSSAAWQEIRVPGWAEVWLPALRAWVRFAVHCRFSHTLVSPGKP